MIVGLAALVFLLSLTGPPFVRMMGVAFLAVAIATAAYVVIPLLLLIGVPLFFRGVRRKMREDEIRAHS